MSGWTVNDLEPPLAGTALAGTAGVTLADATATVVHIRRPDATVISRAVTLGNQTTAPGSWSMAWVLGDLSLPGSYTIELQVTWPGTRPQTFGPATIQVAREIA